MDDYNAIRQLKGRYCQRLDSKDWDGFGALFLDDATWGYSGYGIATPRLYQGRAAIVQHMIDELAEVGSAHHVTSSDLEVLSETEARGRWGAFFMQAGIRIIGCGVYNETYVKTDLGWQFKSIAVDQTMITSTEHFGLNMH